jgi:hypothetical protein
MNDEAAAGPLEDRELRNLAGVTGAEPDVINRIMQAAAEAGIAYLLPPLRATGHYPEWAAFALPGTGKSAHLLVEGQETGLCGVALPYAAIVDLPRGTPLCIGCAFHAKRVTGRSFNAPSIGRAIRATSSRAVAPEPIIPAAANGWPPRRQAKTASESSPANNNVTKPAATPAPPEPTRSEPPVTTSVTPPKIATTTAVPPKAAPVVDAAPSLFDLAS